MKKIKTFKNIDGKASVLVVISMLLVFLFVGNVSAKSVNANINSNGYKEDVSESIVKARDAVVEKIKTNPVNSSKKQNTSTPETNIKQFKDIDKNPYKYAINVLQEKQLVKGYGDKYFPGNHVRMHMLLKVLVNSHRSLTNTDNYLVSDKCVELAYKMGLLYSFDDVNFDIEQLVNYTDFKQILSNFSYQYPSLVDADILLVIPESDEIVTKDKMAYYLVDFLLMLPEGREGAENKDYYFKDTAYHIFGDDVELLADKGIITVRDDQFFIDQFASRADLVVLMSNTLLSLRENNLLDYDIMESDVVDVVGKGYEPQVIYANEQGLLDYILETKRGKTYLYPQELLSKHEAFYTLGLAADNDFNYNIDRADHENITRGELAHAILDAFDFSKAYKYQTSNTSNNAINNITSDAEFINISAIQGLSFVTKIRNFFSSL